MHFPVLTAKYLCSLVVFTLKGLYATSISIISSSIFSIHLSSTILFVPFDVITELFIFISLAVFVIKLSVKISVSSVTHLS